MRGFLSFTSLLAGAALAIAAGPGAPARGPRHEEGRPMAKGAVQEAPSRGKADRADGQSNVAVPQPKRVEDSYPLNGDGPRRESVAALQQVTVDLLAIANMYKEAHWNLSGPLYLQLHEYYDEQAAFYLAQADVFAERVLHLGYSVDGRYSTIARTTKLPEMPAGPLTDNESLQLLLDRGTVLQKEIYQFIHETEDGDPPTSNKFQDLAYAVDKNLWQLRAHIQKPGSSGEDVPWDAPRGEHHPGH